MNRSSASRADPAADHFALFAQIWAAATLVHQLAFTFWLESWQGWLLVGAACTVLHRPSCPLRFGVLAAVSLLNLLRKMPFVPNHILFEGLLHLIVLLGLAGWLASGRARAAIAAGGGFRDGAPLLLAAALLKAAYFYVPGVPHGYWLGAPTTFFLLFAFVRWMRRLPSPGEGGEAFARFAPVMRAAVVVMYFWAGLHKLNWDYLDPGVSCAAEMHLEIASYFGGLVPSGAASQLVAIWGSLALEFGIPLLLLFRRTRYAGFCAAALFHLWLAIHPAAGVFSFSSLILALLALFLPAPWVGRLHAMWAASLRRVGRGDIDRGRRWTRFAVVAVFLTTVFGQGLLYATRGRTFETFQTADRLGLFVFLAWGIWLAACYLLAGWRGPRVAPLSVRARPRLAWVALIPVLLNGLWPWVGGRTQTSFSMYSNLRSEGTGNHLFLRRVDWLPYQTDLVEVLSSDPDILSPTNRPRCIRQFANPGHRILPWFEFRRLVSETEGDFSVTYLRGGEPLELVREGGEIRGDAEAFERLPVLARKFLWFRRLETLEGPMRCTH